MGRATLIKSVAQASPMYTMSAFQVPKVFVMQWMVWFADFGGSLEVNPQSILFLLLEVPCANL